MQNMKLEQIKKLFEERELITNNKDWDNIVSECKKDLLDIGLTEEQAMNNLPNKILATFKKKLMAIANQKKFTAIILGITTPSDYGASDIYMSVLQKWNYADETTKKQMVLNGEITKDGQPLWSPATTQHKFKYLDNSEKLLPISKRLIIPDKEIRSVLVGIFKLEGMQEYFPAKIMLTGKEEISIKVPLFKKVEVNLNVSNSFQPNITPEYRLSNGGLISLYVHSETKFKEISDKELAYDQLEDIFSKYFKNEIVDLSSISNLTSLTSRIKKGLITVIKNAVVIKSQPSLMPHGNNLIMISSESLDMNDENAVISCYVPNHYDLLPEGVSDFIIFGYLTKSPNSEDMALRLSLNTIGLITQTKFKSPAPVNPDNPQEVVEEEVIDEEPDSNSDVEFI